MSVLYKALQKAAKENEQQAAAPAEAPDDELTSPFDPERLAGSGAISSGNRLGGLKANWRVAGLASAVVLALVIVAVFFLVDTDTPAPVQVAQTPPQAPAEAQQGQASPETAEPARAQSPMDLARETASESSAPPSDPATPAEAMEQVAQAEGAAEPSVGDVAMADAPAADAMTDTPAPDTMVAPGSGADAAAGSNQGGDAGPAAQTEMAATESAPQDVAAPAAPVQP